MARVGIGVPVYNGGDLLSESLECLRTQTFQDIEVILSDNASTDQTGDICAAFAARDPRFRHIRQPENIGIVANFVAAREASRADLFMWRAHDDLSAQNYVEALVACFERDPAIRLAVAEIRSEADDRERLRRIPYRPRPTGPRIRGIVSRLFTSHASWIYGLWHRDSLARQQDRVHAAYPHAWGWDHLTLLPFILDDRIGGTGQTHFLQRIKRAGTSRAERRARRPGAAAMRELRADFERLCRAEVDARDWSAGERIVLSTVLPRYIDRRGYSRLTIFKRRLCEGEGVA